MSRWRSLREVYVPEGCITPEGEVVSSALVPRQDPLLKSRPDKGPTDEGVVKESLVGLP